MLNFIKKLINNDVHTRISDLCITVGALVHDFRELKAEVEKIKGAKSE